MSGVPASGGNLRRVLKEFSESFLIGTGAVRVARAYHRSGILVLAYHNIVPHGEPIHGDRSLHLPQKEFARQLDSLQRTHRVVPLPSILESGGRSARPRVAITFDDAYRGAVTVGVEELVRRGMPATIFVAPAYVEGDAFWWDALASSSAGGLDAELRRTGLGELRGQNSSIRAWAARHGAEWTPLPVHQLVASEAELFRVSAEPGITLGSHTWSHPNLCSLTGDELEVELVRALAWLQDRFHTAVPWLSYPYGLHSPLVQQVAERVGYRGALLVRGGWVPRRSDMISPFALPRLNVPSGLSLPGFEIRTAGLLDR